MIGKECKRKFCKIDIVYLILVLCYRGNIIGRLSRYICIYVFLNDRKLWIILNILIY